MPDVNGVSRLGYMSKKQLIDNSYMDTSSSMDINCSTLSVNNTESEQYGYDMDNRQQQYEDVIVELMETNELNTVATVRTKGRNYQPLLEVHGKFMSHTALILLDHGATGDFRSTSFVKWKQLVTTVAPAQQLRLALKSSESGLQSDMSVTGLLSMGQLSEERYFDIADLEHYDIILGMPWHVDYNPDVDYIKRTVQVYLESIGYIRLPIIGRSNDQLIGITDSIQMPVVERNHDQPIKMRNDMQGPVIKSDNSLSAKARDVIHIPQRQLQDIQGQLQTLQGQMQVLQEQIQVPPEQSSVQIAQINLLQAKRLIRKRETQIFLSLI